MLNIAIVFLFLILPIKYGTMIFFFLMDGMIFKMNPVMVTLHFTYQDFCLRLKI